MIHFDAHADTGDIEFGSLWGHGQPMRRLIESGALRGDRFLQIGLRGYWPPPETLDWMAAQHMRSYEMTEIVHRGLDGVPDRGVRHRHRRVRGRVPVGRHRRRATPATPRAPAPRSPAGCPPASCSTPSAGSAWSCRWSGWTWSRSRPPYDHADITAALANRVVLEALSAIARKRRDERDGTRWDPALPLLSERNAPIPVGEIHGHHHATHLSHHSEQEENS